MHIYLPPSFGETIYKEVSGKETFHFLEYMYPGREQSEGKVSRLEILNLDDCLSFVIFQYPVAFAPDLGVGIMDLIVGNEDRMQLFAALADDAIVTSVRCSIFMKFQRIFGI